MEFRSKEGIKDAFSGSKSITQGWAELSLARPEQARESKWTQALLSTQLRLSLRQILALVW